MSDIQRSAKLQGPSTRPRLLSGQGSRKIAIYFLAGLIVSVMIVWFGFLGWGLVAMLQRLLDFWTHL